MEKLYEEPYFYTVERDEATGEYFLEVTCGTSAVFEVRVKLKKKEIRDFLEDPQALQPLANRILGAPDKFIDRKINQ